MKIELIHEGRFSRWRFGQYLSAPYADLERRTWSPLVIGGRLCFVAGNGQQRCVVWGDTKGNWFDDAYDIADDSDVPVHITRNGENYQIVRGNISSALYTFQLTYEIIETGVAVLRFDKWKPWNGMRAEDEMLELMTRVS